MKLSIKERMLLFRLNQLVRFIIANKRLHELVLYYQTMCDLPPIQLKMCHHFNLIDLYEFLKTFDEYIDVI